MARLLVVDDEPSICWGLTQLGGSLGHDVESAASAEQGLRLAATGSYNLLILDVRLPGADGLESMAAFQRVLGSAPIIVITAFGDLSTAVRAVENGAFEYIVKPFDLSEIRAAITRALQISASLEGAAQDVAPDAAALDGMLGRTPAMQAVFKRIALAANSDAAVMLSGESGVGKELAARAIHRHSSRHDAPFVAVNAAALSPSLAEAELFGHVEGAFTDARQARPGLLAHANGGTLFLDEVADIPLPVQVKLLRALDRGEILPVGADKPVKTQFRIIAATHRDLHAFVQAGVFRHDLFYRLNTFEITLPPLRQRRDDIPLLVRYFAGQLGNAAAVFDDDTIGELAARPWYGNVRELRNAVEHALVVARSGAVMPEHLPPPLPQLQPTGAPTQLVASLASTVSELADDLLADPSLAGAVYDRFLGRVEPALFAAALNKWSHQCAPAARALGLHRTTLKRKLQRYGIEHSAGES